MRTVTPISGNKLVSSTQVKKHFFSLFAELNIIESRRNCTVHIIIHHYYYLRSANKIDKRFLKVIFKINDLKGKENQFFREYSQFFSLASLTIITSHTYTVYYSIESRQSPYSMIKKYTKLSHYINTEYSINMFIVKNNPKRKNKQIHK